MSYMSSMYGGSPYAREVGTGGSTPKEDPSKAASRVLGGMKIHNSHIKRVEMGGELVDVPKIEYVKLLEQQVKDLRTKVSNMENKVERLQEVTRATQLELRAIQRDSDKKRRIDGLRFNSRR